MFHITLAEALWFGVAPHTEQPKHKGVVSKGGKMNRHKYLLHDPTGPENMCSSNIMVLFAHLIMWDVGVEALMWFQYVFIFKLSSDFFFVWEWIFRESLS